MKFSVSSYSYASLTGSGKATLFGCIDMAAEAGFDGIEFTELSAPQGIDVMQYADDIRTKCRANGLETVCYCVGADFLKNDVEEEIERVKRQVDIAEVLGVKLMRHDASTGFPGKGYKGFEDALPTLVYACSKITEYAAEKGIRTMVENHGQFCQEPERVEALVNCVADDNFGLLVDIGNFVCADCDSAYAVGKTAPYAFHVHAKDFYIRSGNAPLVTDGWFKSRGGNYLRGAIIGHGDVPVRQCLNTLVSNGYDGYITVEFEGLEDSVMGTKYGLNTLRRILGVLEPINA